MQLGAGHTELPNLSFYQGSGYSACSRKLDAPTTFKVVLAGLQLQQTGAAWCPCRIRSENAHIYIGICARTLHITGMHRYHVPEHRYKANRTLGDSLCFAAALKSSGKG